MWHFKSGVRALTCGIRFARSGHIFIMPQMSFFSVKVPDFAGRALVPRMLRSALAMRC